MILKANIKSVATILVVVAASLFLLVMLTLKEPGKTERPMQVLYYTNTLLRDQRLNLDPTNLDTVQQYYLAENLAVGLVRDDNRAASGYVPALAQSWSHPDDSTWLFELAPNLKWSDGSPIDPQYLAAEVCRFAQAKSRHLRMLRLLTDCKLRPGTTTLEMRFSVPVDHWLLHELSLADAVLVHPLNRQGDWTVTSGPYRVDSFDAPGLTINLIKNEYFVTPAAKSPERVRLFWVKDVGELENAFKSLEVDLFPTLPNVFSRRQVIMSKNAKELYWGFPNTLHVFRFNWANPAAKDDAVRAAFAAYVREALKDWRVESLLAADSQLIPNGHQGRLADAETPPPGSLQPLAGKTLVLRLNPQLKDIPDFGRRLEARAAEVGLKLDLRYENVSDIANDPATFATLYVFKGNQKDALGNWSFLFSQTGPLASFEAEFEPLLGKIAASRDEDDRTALLKELHRQVLMRALAVPAFFENTAIFSSGKYELNGLNSTPVAAGRWAGAG